MSQTTASSSVLERPRKGLWVATVTASALVALVGVFFGIESLVQAIPRGAIAARTICGILVVVWGLLGSFLPVVVGLRRSQFVALSRIKQVVFLLVVPTGYLLLLSLLMILALNSENPVVPVRVPPTVTFVFGDNSMAVHVPPPFIKRPGSVRIRYPNRRGEEEITSTFGMDLLGAAGSQGHTMWFPGMWPFNPDFPGITQTVVAGTATLTGTGDDQLVAKLELELTEEVRFQVLGLRDMTIQLDDRFDHLEETGPYGALRRGKHSVLITGRLAK